MTELEKVGIASHLTRRANFWPAHAITFEAQSLFVQTPGPRAGARLDEGAT